MSCHKLLRDTMRDRGFRMTRQRQMVLGAMHTFRRPVTADEILRSLRASDSRTDIATVYRTLNFLKGFGVISSYDTGNGSRRFEHIHGDGCPHLMCRRCGRISEIDQSTLKNAVVNIGKTSGYDVHLSAVIISGLCPACQRKRTKNKS